MFRLVPRILIVAAICVGVALFLSRAVGASGPISTPWSGTSTPIALPLEGGQLATNGQRTDSNTTDVTAGTSTQVQGTDGDNDTGQHEHNEQNEPNEQTITGTVATVDAAQSMFTLTTSANSQMLVVTNGQTEYSDGLSTVASIHSGMTISIEGSAQSDGRFLASKVKGPSDAPDANNGND